MWWEKHLLARKRIRPVGTLPIFPCTSGAVPVIRNMSDWNCYNFSQSARRPPHSKPIQGTRVAADLSLPYRTVHSGGSLPTGQGHDAVVPF